MIRSFLVGYLKCLWWVATIAAAYIAGIFTATQMAIVMLGQA